LNFLRKRVAPTSGAGETRILLSKPNRKSESYSARRLNGLAKRMRSAHRYLEVGVAQGLTLEQIRVSERWGVDPRPQFDSECLPKGTHFHSQESDEFFKNLDSEIKFDLIFLDGLHTWQQTYTDLLNCLNHAHSRTIILIDDVVPDDELAAFPDWSEALIMKSAAGIEDGRWQGDVFKVMLAIRDLHPELDYCVVGQNTISDNPQAILWVSNPSDRKYSNPDITQLESSYDPVTYSDVFIDQQIPKYFNHLTEKNGIRMATKAIS